MQKSPIRPVLSSVQSEEHQGHETRRQLLTALEGELKRPVVSYFTSFTHPVMIDDGDMDMLEGVLQCLDLSNGLAVVVNSPGGDGLAAERIINTFRKYSKTGEYWAIVPSKAKSAATMICFGASKIIMSKTSELGAVDPQVVEVVNGTRRVFSVYNLVESYDSLFRRAVQGKGRLEPYLMQLSNYDERLIKQYKVQIDLAADIAVRALATGMMQGFTEKEIKRRIGIFLSPERTKDHGRPLYGEEAGCCGLAIELRDPKDPLWQSVHELYVRTENFVTRHVAKCIESKNHSFVSPKA